MFIIQNKGYLSECLATFKTLNVATAWGYINNTKYSINHKHFSYLFNYKH